MNNNNRKTNFYIQVQRWAVRVWLIVGLLSSCIASNELAYTISISRTIKYVTIGFAVLGGGLPGARSLDVKNIWPPGPGAAAGEAMREWEENRGSRSERRDKLNQEIYEDLTRRYSDACIVLNDRCYCGRNWGERYLSLTCWFDSDTPDTMGRDIVQCLQEMEDEVKSEKKIKDDVTWRVYIKPSNTIDPGLLPLPLDKYKEEGIDITHLPIEAFITENCDIQLPPKIGGTVLAKYLYWLDVTLPKSQTEPFKMPRDPENFEDLKELYIRGCNYIKPDIDKMHNLDEDKTYLDETCV